MSENAILDKVRVILHPILGDIMTESTLLVRCKKIGVDYLALAAPDLPRLAPEIQASVTIFVGSEKAKSIAERILSIS